MKKFLITIAMLTTIAESHLTAQNQEKPVRRVLMEEFTGTWCSNCPRGTASVQHLQKLYGDRFIAIAIHQDSYDPMKTNLYGAANGYPNCDLNRAINCDPFFGTSWNYSDPIGVKHDIDRILNQNCYADVEVTANWKDESRSSIEVTATANFFDADNNANYRWAFVVTEDGMHGEHGDRYWMQQNQYVGDTDWLVMPEMEPFVYGSGLMELEYNHVAVDGDGIRQGIEESVPTNVAAKEPVSFVHTIDISGNQLIQDKNNLHIVAILINKNYNDVENVATCDIAAPSFSTAIEDIEHLTFFDEQSGKAERNIEHSTAVYDLQGRIVSRIPAVTPTRSFSSSLALREKGIYIINGKKMIIQ